jgi:hypothetical protein
MAGPKFGPQCPGGGKDRGTRTYINDLPALKFHAGYGPKRSRTAHSQLIEVPSGLALWEATTPALAALTATLRHTLFLELIVLAAIIRLLVVATIHRLGAVVRLLLGSLAVQMLLRNLVLVQIHGRRRVLTPFVLRGSMLALANTVVNLFALRFLADSPFWRLRQCVSGVLIGSEQVVTRLPTGLLLQAFEGVFPNISRGAGLLTGSRRGLVAPAIPGLPAYSVAFANLDVVLDP